MYLLYLIIFYPYIIPYDVNCSAYSLVPSFFPISFFLFFYKALNTKTAMTTGTVKITNHICENKETFIETAAKKDISLLLLR